MLTPDKAAAQRRAAAHLPAPWQRQSSVLSVRFSSAKTTPANQTTREGGMDHFSTVSILHKEQGNTRQHS